MYWSEAIVARNSHVGLVLLLLFLGQAVPPPHGSGVYVSALASASSSSNSPKRQDLAVGPRRGGEFRSAEPRSRRNTDASSAINKKDALICPPGCSSCSTLNGCLACKQRYFLLLVRSGMRQTGVCTLTCPSGYYGVRRKDFSVCLKCNIDKCISCFSKTYCTRCNTPFVAYKGECIDGCPEGLFYANYSKECYSQVNCMVGSWSSWNFCSRNGQTCGYKYGIEARERQVLQVPSHNGDRCPALSENRRCKMLMRSCADLATNRSDPARRMKSGIRRRKRRRKYRKRVKKGRKRKGNKKRRGKKKRRHNKRRWKSKSKSKGKSKNKSKSKSKFRQKGKSKTKPKKSLNIETNEIASEILRAKR